MYPIKNEGRDAYCRAWKRIQDRLCEKKRATEKYVWRGTILAIFEKKKKNLHKQSQKWQMTN